MNGLIAEKSWVSAQSTLEVVDVGDLEGVGGEDGDDFAVGNLRGVGGRGERDGRERREVVGEGEEEEE